LNRSRRLGHGQRHAEDGVGAELALLACRRASIIAASIFWPVASMPPMASKIGPLTAATALVTPLPL
jgi:hypothetical protein